VLKPFEDRYKVVLTRDDAESEMACEVDIKHLDSGTAEKQPDAAKPSSTFSVQNAQSYLDDHGVLQFIQGMIQALVKERPTDPYKYMGRHILNGYDVGGSAPKPPCGKASEKGIHHQAHETVMKLRTPEGAIALEKAFGTPLDRAKPDSPPDSPAKCAPLAAADAEEKCAPPAEESPADGIAPHPDEVDDLRKKAKELLVQGFHSGSLEASLAASNDQKAVSSSQGPVDDLRQKAKGLFVEGFHDGSLEATLLELHSKEQSASAPAEGCEVSKPAEAAEAEAGDDREAAGNASSPQDQESPGAAAAEESREEDKPAEEAKEIIRDEKLGEADAAPAVEEGN